MVAGLEGNKQARFERQEQSGSSHAAIINTEPCLDISIIVPFLGQEKDLARCLESLACQHKREFEVIVVGDGVTIDRAALIATGRALPERLRLHSTEKHEGLFRVRQVGADFASGQYLQFVDHDDTLDPEHLAVLHDLAVRHDADVVECPFRVFNADGSTRIDQRSDAAFIIFGDDILQYFFSERSYNNIVNKIVRKEAWISAMQTIAENAHGNLTYAEDLVFSSALASVSGIHVFSDEVFYNYRYSVESAMNTQDLSRIRLSLENLETVMSSLTKQFGHRVDEQKMKSFQRYQVRWALNHLRKNAGGVFPDVMAACADRLHARYVAEQA